MSTQYQLTALTPFKNIADQAAEACKKAGMAVQVTEVKEVRTGSITLITYREGGEDVDPVRVQVDAECLCNGIYTLDAENERTIIRYGTEADGDKQGKPLNALTGELVHPPLKEKQWITLMYGQKEPVKAIVTEVTLDRYQGVLVWAVRVERTN